MQDIFGEQVQSGPQFFLERLKKPGSMPAPQSGFPLLEGYEVVSVRMRETVITARPQAEVVDAEGQVEAPRLKANASAVAAATLPQISDDLRSWYEAHSDSAFLNQHLGAYATAPSASAEPATRPRKRIAGRDIAMWICVGQLAVIIGWLVGPGMEKPRERAVNAVKTAVISPLFSQTHSKSNQSKTSKKSARNGFVPPPPPEVAHGRMMVPPPPVAYMLPAGAACAGTLPQPAHQEAPAEKKETLTEQSAAEAPHAVKLEQPIAAAVPSEDSEVAPSLPEFIQQAAEEESEPSSFAQPEPQPVRMVMNGHRKRIIADR